MRTSAGRLPTLKLVGLVLLSAAAVAGCSAAPPSSPPGNVGLRVVPWVPLSPAPIPTITPLPVPARTPRCTAAQLDAQFPPYFSALTGGTLIAVTELADLGRRPCQLAGIPTVGLLTASGQPIALRVRMGEDQAATLPQPAHEQPVLLLPGLPLTGSRSLRPGQADVTLSWTPLDEAQGGTACVPPEPIARTAILHLPHLGGSVVVRVPSRGVRPEPLAPCHGVLGVSRFWAVVPNPPAVPQLAARLTVPRQVVAGHTLRYVVVVTNTTPRAFNFHHACSPYVEVLAGPELKLVAQHELDCAPAETLRPRASLAFAMALAIPPTAAHVQATLMWSLQPWGDFAIGPPTAGPLSARVVVT